MKKSTNFTFLSFNPHFKFLLSNGCFSYFYLYLCNYIQPLYVIIFTITPILCPCFCHIFKVVCDICPLLYFSLLKERFTKTVYTQHRTQTMAISSRNQLKLLQSYSLPLWARERRKRKAKSIKERLSFFLVYEDSFCEDVWFLKPIHTWSFSDSLRFSFFSQKIFTHSTA